MAALCLSRQEKVKQQAAAALLFPSVRMDADRKKM